ncbi:MAG: hypothetical protein ABJG78_21185 [Cyclobacteriaceae bacterium]
MNKIIYTIVFAMMISLTAVGQEIDQKRMERDLKIAENILSTLSNNDRNIFSLSRSIESNYIPDYGVIFTLPQSTLVYTSRSKGGITVIAPTAPTAPTVGGSGSSTSSYSYVISDSDDSDSSFERVSGEELSEKIKELLEENMTTFLVDYADLIGQLKPTDRIMVNVKNSNNQVWVSDRNLRTKQSTGRTAEILKSDLIAYKQGKSSREETIKKVKFADRGGETKERDLELFSSIFSRLYEPDMSSTYYASSRNINYERLENLGAIFSMRVYSSSENDGLHTIRTTGERGLTREQRNEKVNAMYPEFEKMFKENMIDYGRTIKSIKPSEMLMFKVRLTECKGCEMPRSIELTVKGSTLSDFDSGKISRDNALKEITVKKTDN